MGKNKNDNWTKEQNFWFTLLLPIALVCAFPILLVPIIIGIVLWIVTDIIKMIEKFKTAKATKEFEENFSKKNLLKEREKIVQSIKKEVNNNVVVYNNDDKTNNTFSFNEILSICDDIENKLLEIEVSYAESEAENEEIDSLFSELEEYENVINEFRNKKLVDLNNHLLDEVQDSYDEFIVLYDEFNELIDSIHNEVIKETKVDYKKTIIDEYKQIKGKEKRDEELEREKYRDELRYVWGLTEYQIGLVESGEYEPCQFSEEELEEDDYYSEDDY